MKTIGFIGTGNMGSALAKAVAAKGTAAFHDEGTSILLANRTPAKAEALAKETGGTVCGNKEAAASADYLFLGVKPQMMADMLNEIAPVLKARQEHAEKVSDDGTQAGAGTSAGSTSGSVKGRFVLVTMAAGLTTQRIAEMAGCSCPVIRIMPNTPAAIGKGVILLSRNDLVTDEEMTDFKNLLSASGILGEIPEHLIDAGSAVSGCGPAFVYMFIEALADGGVACGLPRADAYRYAAQMVAGSAEMVLHGLPATHPGALKDAVCSPGGTTIQGVRTLEESSFRGAVMDAVIAAYEKTLALK